MTSFFWSSSRPRWLNSKLRLGSRSTSCSAGHDSCSLCGASKSFSIHAEYRFSVLRFHVSRNGQTLFDVARGEPDGPRCTTMSRVMVAHSVVSPSRASLACHFPTEGDATSATQKYGGPPRRSRVAVATLPSGATSESSPSSGPSAAKTTRRGAPFHGAIGEVRTLSWAASSQRAGGASLCALALGATNAFATSSNAVVAAAIWRLGNNGGPQALRVGNANILAKLWPRSWQNLSPAGNFGNGNNCSAARDPGIAEKPRLFRPVRLLRLAPASLPPADHNRSQAERHVCNLFVGSRSSRALPVARRRRPTAGN